MQRLEVSGAVRTTHIWVVRRQTVNKNQTRCNVMQTSISPVFPRSRLLPNIHNTHTHTHTHTQSTPCKSINECSGRADVSVGAARCAFADGDRDRQLCCYLSRRPPERCTQLSLVLGKNLHGRNSFVTR